MLWAQVLKSNGALRSLNLESNSIGTAGIEQLADALRVNRSLTEVRPVTLERFPKLRPRGISWSSPCPLGKSCFLLCPLGIS